MKPKQVGEQHKTLFSVEHNYGHRTIVVKKRKEQMAQAKEDIKEFLREKQDDPEGI